MSIPSNPRPNSIFRKYDVQLRRWCSRARHIDDSAPSQDKPNPIIKRFGKRKIREALRLYRRLTEQSEEAYFSRPGIQKLLRKPEGRRLFKYGVEVLHQNILRTGSIVAMPREFWMTEGEAMDQCNRANLAFEAHPDLQEVLADINYSFFRRQTMNSADEMLTVNLRNKETVLDMLGMSHINTGNLTIAFLTADHILRTLPRSQSFHIIDIGAGTGATVAAIAKIINEFAILFPESFKLVEKIHLTAFEACSAFAEALEKKGPRILSKLNESWKERTRCERIQLVVGDVFRGLSSKRFKIMGRPIFVSNYAFHRLSHRRKEEVLDQARKLVIRDRPDTQWSFILADMFQNQSGMPNRGFFNFGLNGPLNPGNSPAIMDRLFKGVDLMPSKLTSRSHISMLGENVETLMTIAAHRVMRRGALNIEAEMLKPVWAAIQRQAHVEEIKKQGFVIAGSRE